MKKTKKLLKFLICVVIIAIVWPIISLGAEFISLTSYNGDDIEFQVEQGAFASDVAADLEELGVIKSKYTFLARLKLMPDEKSSIYHGTHIISKGMTLGDVLKEVTTMPEADDTLTFSIPEGYSVDMIAKKAEKEGLCTYDEFIHSVKNDSFDYEFIKHIPDADYRYKLEGFLFPDTYEFFKDDGAHEIIDKMLSVFEREYKKYFSGYDDMFRLVTIASMVEREAALEEECPRIAGVISNRLEKDMLLQIDATVVYAKSSGRYDIPVLSYADLEVASPYNTYLNGGLPLGPICNPGVKAIRAAASPEKHEWLYYHTDEEKADGSHIFTKTFDEHIATMN